MLTFLAGVVTGVALTGVVYGGVKLYRLYRERVGYT